MLLVVLHQALEQVAPNSLHLQQDASSSIKPPTPSNASLVPSCAPASQQQLGELELQRYVNLSTFWYSFLALITTMGLVVSLVSNMIIIYLFTKTRSLRQNPSNIIAVNLSLSDLLYCTQWPSVIYCSLTQSTVLLEYEIVCQSFGFITVSTALASILTVLAMSVERAIVIKYSIQAKNHFTIRLAWLITVLIWSVSLCSCLPPLFGKFNRYTLDPSKTSCTLDYLSPQSNYKLYILVLYVAFWIVPFVLITISYALIIVTFGRSSLTLRQLADESELEHQLTRLYSAGSRQLCPLRTSPPPRARARLARRLKDSIRLKAQAGTTAPERLDGGLAGVADRRATMRRAASSSILLDRPPVQRQRVRSSDAASALAQQLEAATGAGPTAARRRWLRAISARELRLKMRLSGAGELGLAGSARASPALARQAASCNSGASSAANSQLTRTMLQFRLAKMSLYLILLWLVSWTPIASLAMLNSVIRCHRASATAVFLASTMTKLGPAFDVFIYGISHPRIKSKFRQIFRRLFLPFARNSAACTRSTSINELAATRFSFRVHHKRAQSSKEPTDGARF